MKAVINVKNYDDDILTLALPLRKAALAIDENPQKINDYFDLKAVRFLADDMFRSTVSRTQHMEIFSYGDPGVLLALPGPSLSGIALHALGTERQITQFSQYVKDKKRTFFAITEPTIGSDPTNIKTRLLRKNNQYYLSGEKAFVGNAAAGDLGVVFASMGDHPLSLCFVYLTPKEMQHLGVTRSSLPMYGLRGAQIGCMRFDDVFIPYENILGLHKNPVSRGFLALQTIFMQFRPAVGALALGLAQAVLEYAVENHLSVTNTLLKKHVEQLSAVRNLLQKAALSVDHKSMDIALISMAKREAVLAAEKCVSEMVAHISFAQLLEHPWLHKAYRDVFCFEYMEGTSGVHLGVIANLLTRSNV